MRGGKVPLSFRMGEHNIFGEKHEKTIQDLGEKYIEILIGGHAKTTVGNIVDFKNRGFDV